MLKEFKEFAMRPNLIDIGVGLVMAAALGAVITALVEKILMPIVGIIFGEPSFDNALIATVNGSQILFGAFLTALVTFVAIAFAVFFFIIKPFQAYQNATAQPVVEEAEAVAEELVLLREIRDALKR